MIRGIDVILYRKQQTGEDAFGDDYDTLVRDVADRI